MAWRKPHGELLAELTIPPGTPLLQLPQTDLAEIMLEHIKKCKNVSVIFGTQLVDLEQTEDGVRITLEAGEEKTRMERRCQYLIGADGGKSTVRRLLGITLEGFTWEDFHALACSIVYNLEDYGEWHPANFVVDPEDWAVVINAQPNHWRITFGERPGDSFAQTGDEQKALRKIRQMLPRILPGRTENVEIEQFAGYKMHQRCVSRFVDGRVILAGDAAHVSLYVSFKTGASS